MPKKVDKTQKQNELLAVAIATFAELGYQATTMDEIAERAGVSKGSLYLYFKNKETLFGAVFQWYGEMIGQKIIQAMESSQDEIEQLEIMASTCAAIAVEEREYMPLFLDFWAAASVKGMRHDYAEDLAVMYQEFRDIIGKIIDNGKAKGRIKKTTNTRAIAYLLTGGMDGMYLQSWLSQPRDMKSLIIHAVQAVIDGIKT